MNDEKIKALKKQHGKIHCYKVKDKACYLREPDLDDIDYAQSVSKSNIGFKKALVNCIWIEGDETLRTETKYALGLFGLVSDLIEVEVGDWSKL